MPTLQPSPQSAKPRLLVVGDAVAGTGFSRVAESILTPATSRFDIHQLALNYFGDPHDLPWKLYPAALGGDSLGANRLASLCDHLKPDLIFMISNLPRVQAYLRALGESAGSVPIIAYTAIEAEPVPTEGIRGLEPLASLVFYTEFARCEFRTACERPTEDDAAPPTVPADLRVIPHGIDPAVFHPLEPDDPDREAVKRRARHTLFHGDAEHSQSFIVLNANRNDVRKRIDLTVQGFAEFARDKDRYVKLHLHMGVLDAGWDVIELCRRCGVYDRLIMTNQARTLPSVSNAELNLIYNAADLGINTSSGEGWGLVSFEHAATRTAQAVPHHASCAELWSGSAEMMQPSLTLTEPGSMINQHLLAPEEIAAALERLYADPAHRHDVADRCYQNATRQAYHWSTIAATWQALFDEFL